MLTPMETTPQDRWRFDYLMGQTIYLRPLFQSKVFAPTTPFTSQSQLRWLELIGLVDALLQQALLRGKRIDFTDEVDGQDPDTDATTLLARMRLTAYPLPSPGRDLVLLRPDLNHHYGVGRGQFSNGLAFGCPYPTELAFFVGADRVLFYRHLRRAFIEARHYLLAS